MKMIYHIYPVILSNPHYVYPHYVYPHYVYPHYVLILQTCDVLIPHT